MECSCDQIEKKLSNIALFWLTYGYKVNFCVARCFIFDIAINYLIEYPLSLPLSLPLLFLPHSVVLMEDSPATCLVVLALMSSRSARSAGGATYAPRESLVACNMYTWGTSRFRSAPRTCIAYWSLFARPRGRSWRSYFTMDTATLSGSSDKKVQLEMWCMYDSRPLVRCLM